VLPSTLDALQTPAGRAALAEAATLAPDEAAYLKAHNRLSKRYPAELARAALETVLLRRKAARKFAHPEGMFFTREALEQATSEPIARHRAARFAGLGVVADLCCGIGGDALALAARGDVVAVDRDALHLHMCRLNLAAHGLADRATLIEGDVLTLPLPPIDAAFIDPDRRTDGRRVLPVERYAPPLSAILARLPAGLPTGVKLAPGLDRADLEGHPGEIEFISFEGELREAVLWSGPFAGPRHRATLLPSGETLFAPRPAPMPLAEEPGGFLYEPDPAVIRADLVGLLAERLDARPIDDGLALLSADAMPATPFARVHVVEATLPPRPKAVREYLRGRDVGRVQVRRHGIEIDVAAFERQIRPEGSGFRTVMLTRVLGRVVALVLAATMRE
jgi:SAM-dependent methyltransferase